MYLPFYLWRIESKKPFSPNGKHFRKLPVPYTRCFRGGSHYFRHPKTLQELREIDFFYHNEDMRLYKIKHRSRRNLTPTAWDDIMRSDFENRSWKKNRRTQWREK